MRFNFHAIWSPSITHQKAVMIFVGSYQNEIKGLKVVLDFFKRRRKSDPNLNLFLIGGNKTELLYDEVKNSGAIEMGVLEHDVAIKYIEAADIFLLPTIEKWWIPFSDVPTSVIEALSFNTPVISPTLIHVKGFKKFK